MASDRLQFDVLKDLKKVDGFMTRLLSEKETQKRFFQNPARVMIELGFHPPTTNRAIGITNQVFYATLANRRLVRYALETAPKLKVPEEWKQKTRDGLRRGLIRRDQRIDELALEAYWNDEKRLRTMMLVTLRDLNKQGILQKRYSAKDLSEYVDKVMECIRQRRPLRDVPLLERFGPRYGIGAYVPISEGDSDAAGSESDAAGSESDAAGSESDAAGSESDAAGSESDAAGSESDAAGAQSDAAGSESDAAGSESDAAGSESNAAGSDGDNNVAVVPVEVVGIVTVVLPIAIVIPVLVVGDPDPNDEELGQLKASLLRAYEGDLEGLQSAATVIRLVSFASDLAFYVQNVQRYGYFGAR